MKTAEAKRLKIGDRICWRGELADQGTVTAVGYGGGGVTITWDHGASGSIRHEDMHAIEGVPPFAARKS